MKRLILATAVILLATAAVAHDRPVSTGSVQAVNDAAAPAVAVVDAFHAALGSGDPEAVLSMLTEDVMVLEEGGAERSRDEYAGHHLRADMTFAAATTTEVTRRASWIEGNVAWVLTDRRDHDPAPRWRCLAHPSHPLVVTRAALTLTWTRVASGHPSPRPNRARRRPPPSRRLC